MINHVTYKTCKIYTTYITYNVINTLITVQYNDLGY